MNALFWWNAVKDQAFFFEPVIHPSSFRPTLSFLFFFSSSFTDPLRWPGQPDSGAFFVPS